MTLTIKCVVLTNSNCLTIALGLGNIRYRVRAVSTDRDCFHYTYWIFLTPLKLLMCENIDKFKLEVWNLKVLNLKVSSLFELLLLARECLSLTQESVYVQYVQHLQCSFECWVAFLFSFVFSFCFVLWFVCFCCCCCCFWMLSLLELEEFQWKNISVLCLVNAIVIVISLYRFQH